MDKQMTPEEKRAWLYERLKRATQDEDFRAYCIRCKQDNPNFAKALAMCEKIARIDINNISIDDSKLVGGYFSFDETRDAVIGFYGYLDRLTSGKAELLPQIIQNAKYLTTKVAGRKDTRSCCGVHTEKDGSVYKEIFINPEGRIGDVGTTIHEFCHSLSKSFLTMTPRKDERVAEVCTVMTDQLCSIFLKKAFPQYEANFDENLANIQVCNVIKARESLLQGVIMNVMDGTTTLEDAVATYGDMFGSNTNILERCLDQIESYNFQAMFESKYLVPQAIALEMADRFILDPEGTVGQFKEVLSHDTEWDMGEILDYLGLPQEEELIDNYVAKYHERMANYQQSPAQIEGETQGVENAAQEPSSVEEKPQEPKPEVDKLPVQ